VRRLQSVTLAATLAALAILSIVLPGRVTATELRGSTAPRAGGPLLFAHNAGDAAGTARRALAAHADVIEIDVVLIHGKLRAMDRTRHTWFLLRERTLATAWAGAGTAAIQLDLKGSSADFVERVNAFLRARPGRAVYLVAPDEEVLTAIGQGRPQVTRLLAVKSAGHLAAVLAEAPKPGIDGVAVRYVLLSADSVQQLRGKGLLVFAWVVNDAPRAVELTRWGVQGLTTDQVETLGRAMAGTGS